MDPTVAYCMKKVEDVHIFLDPLPMQNKNNIIIPVNNNKEHQAEQLAREGDGRGTH